MKGKSKRNTLKSKLKNKASKMTAFLTASADITKECCGNLLGYNKDIKEYNLYLMETSDGNYEE